MPPPILARCSNTADVDVDSNTADVDVEEKC